MIKKFVQSWDKHKDKLESYFRNTPMGEYSEYKQVLMKLIELVINEEDYFALCLDELYELNADKYGGELVLLVGTKRNPSITDYIVTSVDYGSCSGCDTLLQIMKYEDGLPNEEQVKGFMTIALHLLQKMKRMDCVDDDK